MDDLVQWGITTIVGILTFFGGRGFERRKQAQTSRLLLLKPIEQWVDDISRLSGMVGDDISSLRMGLSAPMAYSMKERGETAKKLQEQKTKVLGILQSSALRTSGTKTLSLRLHDLMLRLSQLVERDFLTGHSAIFTKINNGEDATPEIIANLSVTAQIDNLIQEILSTLAELKTQYN